MSTPPTQFKIEIMDAYKSPSMVFLVRMRHETFARLSSVLEMKYVLYIEGPSLIHTEPLQRPNYRIQATYQVKARVRELVLVHYTLIVSIF